MMNVLKSIYIWTVSAILILIWVPILAVMRLFDLDPALYRTGRMYRRLGLFLVRVNPNWKVEISGETIDNPRNPYVVVANHQSMGDIPVVSNLPWEMKWVGKEELFKIPIVGWQMKLAGDIPVNRRGVRRWEQVAKKAGFYLDHKCSIMIFPEGTRTKDGSLGRFADGAFALAVMHQVPILPLVVEGTFDCLPKNSWLFGKAESMKVKVLAPIPTEGMTSSDVPALRERVHKLINDQLTVWRSEA
jgi:1-acyl-sn-glycerol-3-phosphate acyltransferase